MQKRSGAIIHSSDEEEPSLNIEDSPKQRRMIGEMDKDENINLVSEQKEVHEITEPLKDDDDATLTETLLNIKRSTTKHKGKGIMQETKLLKKLKKREMIQLSLDEELAQKLHAEELAKETSRQEQESSKDRPPMLAPGNYVQWKSRIKRYIDTKSNHELIYYYLENPLYELGWKDKEVPTSKGSPITRTESVNETYKNVSQEIRDQLNVEAEAVQIILTGIDNDIYSIVDACPNACEMWKAIERFYKMMNELIRNQCKVTNHQVNVQFLLQLQPEWQRFVTLVKQSQELQTVSYHILYDILKQHQHEVNEIRAEKIECVANPLALVAQQQPVYHP
uniref:Gag-Pol polyprotein n=1 Tax=Tanacetum cinerariifolium TaxID=118510 RepID=A0A699IBH3_TANCI|nr:hypothetical protein [Tanacetum cinerariifolium]